MNDISSADNLFEVLLEAAYFRLGLENWTPVYVAEDKGRPRSKEFGRLVESVSKPWIIFLNARETPGANTAEHKDVCDPPHLWLDHSKVSPEAKAEDLSSDQSSCVEDFLDFLDEMWKVPGISVVLLCRDDQDRPPVLIEQLRNRALLKYHARLNMNSAESLPFSEDDVVSRAVEWTENDPDKQRFLHALVLMQRPRLLSTIWSPAVSTENTENRIKWVDDLEKRGWCGGRQEASFGFIRALGRPSEKH
jgi:hypothetical protein